MREWRPLPVNQVLGLAFHIRVLQDQSQPHLHVGIFNPCVTDEEVDAQRG